MRLILLHTSWYIIEIHCKDSIKFLPTVKQKCENFGFKAEDFQFDSISLVIKNCENTIVWSETSKVPFISLY